MTSPAPPADILAQFPLRSVSITPQAGGHINRSWRLDTAAGPFLLQRLNPDVFPDGRGVMRNILRVSRHIAKGLQSRGATDIGRRTLQLLPANDGQPAVQADDGAWWRVMTFIDGTVVQEKVATPEEAFQAGRAFGEFLMLLADFDGSTLAETIPGFRNTAGRLAQLDRVVSSDLHNRAAQVRPELAALDARRHYAALVPPLMTTGALPRRVVHNDAKSGNVLRDAASGAALAVIDLDTVMPGTSLSDVGDLIRSMASPTDEDERDLSKIAVNPALIEGLARGYFTGAGDTLVAEELRQFIAAGLVTTYEQTVRFFADYLQGDRYYHTTRPGQNLDRGRAQLRLLQELEGQRPELERMVTAL